MNYEYDALAFAGRFHPFHDAHKFVVDQGLKKAKVVAMFLGSHDQPRNSRNPFTTAERIEMITAVYPNEVASGRIRLIPQYDYRYNDDRWIADIQSSMSDIAAEVGNKIGLIGHSKDSTSYYLKIFPTWGSIEVSNFDGIDATSIRKAMFAASGDSIEAVTPAPVYNWLTNFMLHNPAYDYITAEMEFITNYKKQFESLPYPPIFQTVDSVVIQSGHILLVKRGAMPGKGLWALPGGFLDANEKLLNGAIRELREETKIALSDEILKRCVTKQRVFDDPNRSLRGRTITTAFLIELRAETKLTKVKGSDDAEKARWVPLSEVKRNMLYEDHYDIISEMVGI